MAVGYCNGTSISSKNRCSAEKSDTSICSTLNRTGKTTTGLVLKELPSKTGLICPHMLPAAHKGLNLEMRSVLPHNDFQQTIKFINKKRRESGKAELSEKERAHVESAHIFRELKRYCTGETRQHKKVKGHKKHHHSKNKITVRNENFSPKYLDFSKIPTSYTVKPLFSPLDTRKAACELVKNGIEWWTGVVDRSYPVYGYANPGKGYLQNLWTGHLNEEVSARKGPETRTSEEKTSAKENIPAVVDSHKKADLDSSKHQDIQGKNHLLPMAKSNDGPRYSIPGLRDLGNYVSYLPLGISGAFATLSSSLPGKALGVLGLVASQSKSTQAAQLDTLPITEKPDLPLAKESSAQTEAPTSSSIRIPSNDKPVVTQAEINWLGSEPWNDNETEIITHLVLGMISKHLRLATLPDDANNRNPRLQTDTPHVFNAKGLNTLSDYISQHGTPHTPEQTKAYMFFAAQVEERENIDQLTAKAATIITRIILDESRKASPLIGDIAGKSLLEITSKMLIRFFPDSQGNICNVSEIDNEGNDLTVESTELTKRMRAISTNSSLDSAQIDELKKELADKFSNKGNEWLIKATLSRVGLAISYMEPTIQALMYSHLIQERSTRPSSTSEERQNSVTKEVLKKVVELTQDGQLVLVAITLLDLVMKSPEACDYLAPKGTVQPSATMTDSERQEIDTLLSKIPTILAESLIHEAEISSMNNDQFLDKIGLDKQDFQWLENSNMTTVEREVSQVIGLLKYASSVFQETSSAPSTSSSRKRRDGQDAITILSMGGSALGQIAQLDPSKVEKVSTLMSIFQLGISKLSRQDREKLSSNIDLSKSIQELALNAFTPLDSSVIHEVEKDIKEPNLDPCGIMDMLNPVVQAEEALMTMINDIAAIANSDHMTEAEQRQIRYHYQQEYVRKMSGKTDWEKFSSMFRETWKFGPAKVHELRMQILDKEAGEPLSSLSAKEIAELQLGKDAYALISGLFAEKQLVDGLLDLEAAMERASTDVCEYVRDGFMIGLSAHALSADLFAESKAAIETRNSQTGIAPAADPAPHALDIPEPSSPRLDELEVKNKELLNRLKEGGLHPHERMSIIRELDQLQYDRAAEQRRLSPEYADAKNSQTRKVVREHIHHIRSMLYKHGIDEIMVKAKTKISGQHELHYLPVHEREVRVTDKSGNIETKTEQTVSIGGTMEGEYRLLEAGNDRYILKKVGGEEIYPGLFEKDSQGHLHKLSHDGHHFYQFKERQLIDSYPAEKQAEVKETIVKIKEIAKEHSYGSEHDTHTKGKQLYDALKAEGFAMGAGRTVEATITHVGAPFHYHHTVPTILLEGRECVVDAGIGRHHLGSSHEVIIMPVDEWLAQLRENLGIKENDLLVAEGTHDLSEVARIRCRRAGGTCIVESRERAGNRVVFLSRFSDEAKVAANEMFSALMDIMESESGGSSSSGSTEWNPQRIKQTLIQNGYKTGFISLIGEVTRMDKTSSETFSAPTILIEDGGKQLEFVVDGGVDKYTPGLVDPMNLIKIERWQGQVCERLGIYPENSTLMHSLPEEEALSQGGKKSRKSKNQSDNHGQSAAKRTKSSEKTGADIADVENDDQGINSQPDQIEQAGTNTGGSGSALTLEQIDKARGQLYSERNQLNKLESTIQNKRQRLQQAKNFKSEQEALVKRLEKDNNPNNRESRRLQKKAANANIRRQVRLIPQLTKEIQNLQSKLASRDGKLREIQERLDELSIMSEKLPNTNMRPKTIKNLELLNLATEKRMLIEADSKLAELESDINQRKLLIETNYKKTADINKALETKSGQERASLIDERAKLTDSSTHNRIIIKRKEQEVARLKSLILNRDTRLREIAEREVELGKTTAISPEKIKSLEEEISKLSNEINTLREERQELDRIKGERKLTKDEQLRYKKSRDGIANKNTQIENKRKEISRIKEKLDLIPSEIEAAGKSVREKAWANKEISLANAKLLKVKRKIEILKKEIARQKRLRNSTRANKLKSELSMLEREKSNIEIRKRDIRGKKITAPDASSARGGLSASANHRIQQSQRMMSLQIKERISSAQEEVLRNQLASAQNSMAREQIIDLLDEVQIQNERNVIEIEEIMHQQLQDESRELLSTGMDGAGIPEPDLRSLERTRIEQLQTQVNSLESMVQSQQGNAFDQVISDNGYEGIFSLPESTIPEVQKIIDTFVNYTQEIFSTLDKTDVFDQDDVAHINQRVQEQSSKLTAGVKMAEVAKKAIDSAMEALEEARNNLLIKRRQSRQSSSAIQATTIRKQLTIRQKEYARIRRNLLIQKRKLSTSMEKVALNVQRSATDAMGLAKTVQKDSIRKLITLSDEIRGFVAHDNEYQPFNVDDNSGFMDIESTNIGDDQQIPDQSDIHETNADIESNNPLLNQIASIAQEENNQQLIEAASALEEIEQSQEQKTLEEQLKALEQELITLRGQYDQLSQQHNPSQHVATDAIFSEIESRETQYEVSSLARESINNPLPLNLVGIPTELADQISKVHRELEESAQIASNFRRQAEVGRSRVQALREEVTNSLTDLVNKETEQALSRLTSDTSISAIADSTHSEAIDLYMEKFNTELNQKRIKTDFKIAVKKAVVELIEAQRIQADSLREEAIVRYKKVQEEFIQRYFSESTNPQATSVEVKLVAQEAISKMNAELLRQHIETERQATVVENYRAEIEKIIEAESSYTNLIQQSLTTLQEAAEKLKEAKRKK